MTCFYKFLLVGMCITTFPISGWASPPWKETVGIGLATTVWNVEDSSGYRDGEAIYGRINYSADNLDLFESRQRFRFRSRLEFGAAGTEDDATFGGAGLDLFWGYGAERYAVFVEMGTQKRGFDGVDPASQHLSFAGVGLYSGRNAWSGLSPFIFLPIDRQFFRFRKVYEHDTGGQAVAISWEAWKLLDKDLALTFEFESGLLSGTDESQSMDFGLSVALGVSWLLE